MDRAPRFSSLFFRQRLNATVLPMLGGIALFLLLPSGWAAPLLLLGGGVWLLGVCAYGWQNNRMMAYVEGKLYGNRP